MNAKFHLCSFRNFWQRWFLHSGGDGSIFGTSDVFACLKEIFPTWWRLKMVFKAIVIYNFKAPGVVNFLSKSKEFFFHTQKITTNICTIFTINLFLIVRLLVNNVIKTTVACILLWRGKINLLVLSLHISDHFRFAISYGKLSHHIIIKKEPLNITSALKTFQWW